MIDYGALLFDPVYAEIGVPATMNGIEITVIDDTRAKSLPVASASVATAAAVRSVGPGAFARVYELTAKGLVDYKDATLSFNGQDWVVYSWERRGSPNGEDAGEVRLHLKESATS